MFSRILSRAHSTAATAGRLNATTASLLNTQRNKSYEFNWRKYVDEKRNPDFILRGFRQYDTDLAEIRTAAADADKVVEPIDWSYWESQIDDKASVRAIRQEYENTKFPVPASLDVTSIQTEFEELLTRANKIAKMVKEDLVELEDQLVIAHEDHRDYPNYSFWDHVRKNPGILEQMAEEHDEGFIVLLPSEWEFYKDKPFGKIRQAFNEGAKLPQIPPTMPFVWGHYDERAEYDHFIKWEEENFGHYPDYWTEMRPYYDSMDPMKAYFAAYDAIDEEIAHFDAYAPEGGH